jgi:hypothetical protein
MSQSIARTIATLRKRIKNTTVDSVFSDSYLYDEILMVRNDFLIKELSKGKIMPPDLWKVICIEVCPSDFIPCDCIPDVGDYTVLKSKEKIPSFLTSKQFRYIQLMTVDSGLQISYKTPIQGKAINGRLSSDKLWFTVLNDYLYIINHPTNSIKVLMLNILLEDPKDAALLTYCDELGTLEGSCYNPNEDSFNIPPSILNTLLREVLKNLGVPLQLPDDVSVNTDSTMKKY